MKKLIVNLGKKLNKVQQKAINGGNIQSCPPFGCYYSDEPIPNTPATYCGTCGDYQALPNECKSRVFAHADCENS